MVSGNETIEQIELFLYKIINWDIIFFLLFFKIYLLMHCSLLYCKVKQLFDLLSGMQPLKQDLAPDRSNLPVLNVTAQMVLLCAWRTVKEVSLLLGELSEQAPISSTEDTDNL